MLYDQVVLKEFGERYQLFRFIDIFPADFQNKSACFREKFGIFPQRAYFFGFKIAF